MAAWQLARPTISTSTGTPAAVRARPQRMAGVVLALAPGRPLAAAADGWPGAPPHPATAPAASAASTLTATARERPRMGASFPRTHHALYQGALASRRPRSIRRDSLCIFN